MATVVEFKADGTVRINEGASPSDFKGKDILVNPVFPRGIPPHQWVKHKDGYIVGTIPQTKKIDLTVLKYLGACLLGALIGYLIRK